MQFSSPNNYIGKNESWQDLTASRSANVVYTNTSNMPIMVCIAFNSTNTDKKNRLLINGVPMPDSHDEITGSVYAPCMFIVPAGATYEWESDSTAPTIEGWAEFK